MFKYIVIINQDKVVTCYFNFPPFTIIFLAKFSLLKTMSMHKYNKETAKLYLRLVLITS